MAKLTWDAVGSRTYETGVRQGTLYPQDANGAYPLGVAWNGLSSVTLSPSGAEANPVYADDIKYLNLISAEELGASVEAFTYPDEFGECDGSVEVQDGVQVGQQKRTPFGLAFKTVLGNDVDGQDHGYKLHLIYGAMAAPSERAYASINESPEAITFSWEITTTPVIVAEEGLRPVALITIDSTKADPTCLATLEETLFGKDGTPGVVPHLPLPDEVFTIMTPAGG